MIEALFNAVDDAYFVQDAKTGQVLLANKSALDLCGKTEAEILSSTFAALFPGDGAYTLELFDHFLRKSQAEGRARFDWQSIDGDGRPFRTEIHLVPFEHAGGRRIAVSLQDVSRNRAFNDLDNPPAFIDQVTGAASKNLLLERIGQAIKRKARDPNHIFCLFSIDIDGFKIINNRFGHGVGNEVLHIVADRLASCTRSIDTVSRCGDDDFIVLLDGLETAKTAVAVLKRIRKLLSLPIPLADQTIHIRSTVGMAFGDGDQSSPDELVRQASVAMHLAHDKHRHRYRVFSPSMHKAYERKISFEQDLEQAMDGDELYMVYQPITRLDTGEWTGLEALLRWRHRTYGATSPAEFIPILEQSRKMPQLDAWIVRRVVEDVSSFLAAGPTARELEIAVNISAKHFMKFEFIARIDELLKACSRKDFKLCFEMTETSMMSGSGFSLSRYESLRAQGFKIAIDDFGTGWSSLSHLSRLPVDKVKIDRRFIQNVLKTAVDRKITKAIIGLANDLGFQVIAEGIETEAQRETLLAFGCEYGQGFLFSQPLSKDDIIKRVQAG